MDILLGTLVYILIFLFFKKKSRYFHPVKKIVFLAIGVKYFFALYHLYIGPFPVIGVLPDSGNDEMYFFKYATNFPSSMTMGWSELFSIHLYPIVLGFVFKVLGAYKFVGAALNSFLGILILINVYKISELIWDAKIAKRAAVLFLLIPMQSAYSVILIREAMFTCLLTSSIYLFICWRFNHQSNSRLFYSFFCLFLTVFLHDAAIIILVPFLFHILKYKNKLSRLSKTVIISGLLAVVVYGGVLNYTLKNVSEEGISAEKLGGLRDKLSEKDRSFSYAKGNSNPITLMFHFLLRPFLWEYHTGFFRVFNTLAIYMLLYIAVKKFRFIRQKTESNMLLTIIFLLIFVYAFGSGDLYQSDRHRSKIIPLIVALVPLKKIQFK